MSSNNNEMKTYHISRHYLGDTATFTPRVPVSQNQCEIDLPARVCAAKTIEQCWLAIKDCSDLFYQMKKNPTTGYYFFIYEFDSEQFVDNTSVLDFAQTGEMVSFKPVQGVLKQVFYANKWRMHKELADVMEDATFEEAASAYYDWQQADLIKIEAIVEAAEWA
jgi:hypothetical protein